jgi:hypothetical protein
MMIEKSKVRGLVVKGMGKGVFRFIPLPTIPLTALRPFPDSLVCHSDNDGGILLYPTDTP